MRFLFAACAIATVLAGCGQPTAQDATAPADAVGAAPPAEISGDSNAPAEPAPGYTPPEDAGSQADSPNYSPPEDQK